MLVNKCISKVYKHTEFLFREIAEIRGVGKGLVTEFRKFFGNVFYDKNTERVWTKGLFKSIKRNLAYEIY